MENYRLFDRNTQAVIFGLQTNAIQRMLDFDTICKRDLPSVAAIINPTSKGGLHKAFFAKTEVMIPIYRTTGEALKANPAIDTMVNFASFRSAYPTTMEALDHDQLRVIAVIAEGIPERYSKAIRAKAQKKGGKILIGPATVGGMTAGAFKIGNSAGMLDNIIECKLHMSGSVGFVSKSGGLSNEANNIIARNADGLCEGIAIGGDRYPFSTLSEQLIRMNKNPDIKMLVLLGEVGGEDEYLVIEAMKNGQITKPIVAWCIGTCADIFPDGVQFGHAGARADASRETSRVKNKALAEAGAIVPDSFDDYGLKINQVYKKLVADGVIIEKPLPAPPTIPKDLKTALADGSVRKAANFVSSISDDRGDELAYGGPYGDPRSMTISEVFEKDIGLGGVISLLWFKKLLPPWATKFIEMVICMTADHGPAVSGAHNAIVTARAGKDVISCIVSGMMTIGPRFGGAVAGAATNFSQAFESGLSPLEFVTSMKKAGANIPGIGHRIKSVQNPDKRVELLVDYGKKNFPSTTLLDYALEVEKITTSKRNNLILNVDGCIGILFVDLMHASDMFSKAEIDEVLSMEGLNALFVLGRTIGMMGHVFDQKRLKQPLYRHPWDDILYI
ncbi:MAG: citrate/2-methylcitrate synthase [Pseudomonadota bacterium]